MQNRKILIALVALVAVVGGWYLFRPERLWINQRVNETLVPTALEPTSTPSAEPMPLLTGSFHSGAHETKGTATLYALADGKRILRLTGFETSNGPDVQVYLVAAADAKDNATVTRSGFLALGGLKGNVGDQNYDVPADADLDQHRAVTIWCRRFGVNFGTAPLASAEMTGTMGAVMESGTPGMTDAQTLVAGMFHGVAHETQGKATVYRLEGGRRVLRFTDFHTSNGPDVQVYLVAADDASDNATVTRAGFVHLAALKGNQGDQNYEIPADLDLAKYKAVTVWCRRFGVNFATAPLVARQ